MKNEILEELWKVKDGISEEYENNIDAIVKVLREKEEKEVNPVVDLSPIKKVTV